jgi:hypothetical protein
VWTGNTRRVRTRCHLYPTLSQRFAAAILSMNLFPRTGHHLSPWSTPVRFMEVISLHFFVLNQSIYLWIPCRSLAYEPEIPSCSVCVSNQPLFFSDPSNSTATLYFPPNQSPRFSRQIPFLRPLVDTQADVFWGNFLHPPTPFSRALLHFLLAF